MDESSPIFAIAVAAELSGLHPQTLRQYDRLGMVSPRRTPGQSRRYSMRFSPSLALAHAVFTPFLSLSMRSLSSQDMSPSLAVSCCARFSGP